MILSFQICKTIDFLIFAFENVYYSQVTQWLRTLPKTRFIFVSTK